MESYLLELQSVKRSKLQKLAKKIGIKANQTNKQLIEAIQEYQVHKTQSNVHDSHITTESSTSDNEKSLTSTSITFQRDKYEEHLEMKTNLNLSVEKQIRRRTRTLSGPKEATKVTPDCLKENTTFSLDNINTKNTNIKKNLTMDHGKIPRFAQYLNKKKTLSTPNNKNWKSIHQKKFQTMESIGDYLDRKKKRHEQLSSSTKTPKISKIPGLKMNTSAVFTHGVNDSSSPVLILKQTNCFKRQPFQLNKLKHVSDTPNKILNKTPNCSKNTFNLEESLKKPLNYKPYKGPIRALHPKDLKKPSINNSKNRLAEKMMKQKEMRANILMQHRKII